MAERRHALFRGLSADMAKAVEAIERDHMRLSGRPFEVDLTRNVVRALAPLIGSFDTFFPGYSAFIAAKEEKLSYVLQNFGGDVPKNLVTQPEGLLVFYFLDLHMMPELMLHWPESIPYDVLETMESIWCP